MYVYIIYTLFIYIYPGLSWAFEFSTQLSTLPNHLNQPIQEETTHCDQVNEVFVALARAFAGAEMMRFWPLGMHLRWLVLTAGLPEVSGDCSASIVHLHEFMMLSTKSNCLTNQ